MAHDPMSLKDLPEYLKSIKAKGDVGDVPVVDMGQIVVPQRSYLKWSLAAMLMFVALGGGVATYNSMSTNQLTVIMDVDNGANLSQIVSDSGGEAISVTQKEDSTYEVKVNTRKSRSAFLEWLRNNRNVKKAELEE